jgi:2-oxoglutarate ferredoxin oxidoreductase subunit gamma
MRREIRLQGMNGQGIVAAARIVGEAVSLHDGKEAIMTEYYGPRVVGGWSRADLIISDDLIDYPLVAKPDVLVAMSQDGLDNNWKSTRRDALILVEASYVTSQSVDGRRLFSVPASGIAEKIGRRDLANIVMLGFLTAKTGIVSRNAMESTVSDHNVKRTELDLQAFTRGYELS